jgi:methyl-accepting chemotaxis protein
VRVADFARVGIVQKLSLLCVAGVVATGATGGVGRIAGNIAGVADATASTSEGVDAAQNAASELARMSPDLRQLVSHFR